jgi:uncharacterized paraquat-inducible protein A
MADEEQHEKDQGPDEPEAAEESSFRRCPRCKAQVSEDADICPRCKRDLTQPAGKRIFSIIVLIFVAVMIVLSIWAVFFPGQTKTPTTANAPTTAPS